MRRIILGVLLGCSMAVCAENKFYTLTPIFNGMNAVEFIQVDEEGGRALKGYLTSKSGERYSIPDMCEPEGGDAELIDAYTIKGKENYFLFTCAWSVRHPGIGLNGTQYETFVYVGKSLASIVIKKALSQSLSGYEGSLEGGGSSYAWYFSRKIASEKILELEAGDSKDSLALAHDIVLTRLSNGDFEAIKSYLSSERIQQLLLDFPISKPTVTAYNDFGYALGLSGEDIAAYKVLMEVEKFAPERVVLKLNIADALWPSDKEKSKIYYKEYIDLMRSAGKERLIPAAVFKRMTSDQ